VLFEGAATAGRKHQHRRARAGMEPHELVRFFPWVRARWDPGSVAARLLSFSAKTKLCSQPRVSDLHFVSSAISNNKYYINKRENRMFKFSDAFVFVTTLASEADSNGSDRVWVQWLGTSHGEGVEPRRHDMSSTKRPPRQGAV
jgi:hypothetical protein